MQQDFQVGEWLVRPRLGKIERGNDSIHLKPKAMAVLAVLGEANGAVVSRNEILDAVWPGMAVTDDVLTQCVVELRKAVGDSARDPQFIETIPKLGLRLIPPISTPASRAETIATSAAAAAADDRPAGLFAELRRRHVVRVAAVYAVVAWLILQIAEVTFEPLQLPAWAMTLVVVLAILGFPVAVVLAWAFEITPDGVVRASAAPEAAAPAGGRRIDLVIIAVLLVGVAAVWYLAGPTGRQPVQVIDDVQTIAVLPFDDLSPGKDQEYLADGLAEELLNRLATLKGLQVAGRTSSFFFKGKNEAPRAIGEILHVGHILDGSVRKADDQLRITAQLVDTTNGYQVWTQNYDRKLQDLFAIQDEIAESVANALSVTLGVGDLARAEGGTTNLAAYEQYLLGQSLFQQFGPDTVPRAIEHFRTAVALDPSFALGWERLADIYTTAALGLPPKQSEEWQRKGDEALARATSLAPNSPKILKTTASTYIKRGQWQNAQRILRQITALDTGSGDSHGLAAELLFTMGRSQEAIQILQQARRLDPLSGPIAFYLGHAYTQAERFDEALAELERGIPLSLSWMITREALFAALATGDQSLIETWLARARAAMQPGDRAALLGTLAASLDDPEAALAELERVYASGSSPADNTDIALWAGYFGGAELALQVAADISVTGHYWHPLLADMRRLPGFKERVREAGLVDYWRTSGWGEFCKPVGEDDFECR